MRVTQACHAGMRSCSHRPLVDLGQVEVADDLQRVLHALDELVDLQQRHQHLPRQGAVGAAEQRQPARASAAAPGRRCAQAVVEQLVVVAELEQLGVGDLQDVRDVPLTGRLVDEGAFQSMTTRSSLRVAEAGAGSRPRRSREAESACARSRPGAAAPGPRVRAPPPRWGRPRIALGEDDGVALALVPQVRVLHGGSDCACAAASTSSSASASTAWSVVELGRRAGSARPGTVPAGTGTVRTMESAPKSNSRASASTSTGPPGRASRRRPRPMISGGLGRSRNSAPERLKRRRRASRANTDSATPRSIRPRRHTVGSRGRKPSRGRSPCAEPVPHSGCNNSSPSNVLSHGGVARDDSLPRHGGAPPRGGLLLQRSPFSRAG